MSAECRCPCQQTRYTVTGPALLRAVCHCTLCQQFNRADYADIVIYRERDVQMPPEGQVAYETLRPPPAVQRGRCAACGKPAVERFAAPGLPRLVIVPVANVAEPQGLPPVALHMFYNRRRADVAEAEGLPTYSGYWPSQLGFMRHLLPRLLRR